MNIARIAAGVIVAMLAAYSGSFSLDLFVGAIVGFYPFSPFTPPVFTWAGIAIALQFVAQRVSTSRRWTALPYFIGGAIATMTGIFGPHRYSILVGISLLAVAVLLWVSPSRVAAQPRGDSGHRAFLIGEYRLDAPITDLAGLMEFSAAEYAIMRRKFEGEKNYNAPPVIFLRREWKLQLGTVHDRIYKIAPYLRLTDKKEANILAMETLRYCTQQLGKPSQQQTGLFVWDTDDGNVVLQTGETAEGFVVSLFITSRSVRSFKQREIP